jgi:protein involved in polysaccharide export with SLBB domain
VRWCELLKGATVKHGLLGRSLRLYPALLLLALLSGCNGLELGWWNWFNPSQPVRTPEQPTVNPILPQISTLDQSTDMIANATFPKTEDLQYSETDYIIGPGDIVRVTVLDLLIEGAETPMERQVSLSGYIDLLMVPYRVKAAGLTSDQLSTAVKKAYEPDILKSANVSVALLVQRMNTFNILGAIARPGQYNIARRNFTLLEALAVAGDVNQTNVPWMYVIRPNPQQASPPPQQTEELPALPTLPTTTPATTTQPGGSVDDQLKDLERFIPGTSLQANRAARPSAKGRDDRVYMSDLGNGAPASAPTSASAPADLENAIAPPRYIYSGGQWVPVPEAAKGGAPAAGAKLPEVAKDPYGWMKYDMSHLARIIAIDLPRLKSGDPRMNIIVRDNDIIQVPNLEIGEFYVMGEVLRPGVYSLTGRRVTSRQALAAAGNLGEMSWPNNTILVRRIGSDREQMIPLPLQDIIAGREPDVFLKPNDVIAVGSHWAAPFLAVWRNAFRLTYGFGFIYDRNYSERDFEIPIFWPKPGFRP